MVLEPRTLPNRGLDASYFGAVGFVISALTNSVIVPPLAEAAISSVAIRRPPLVANAAFVIFGPRAMYSGGSVARSVLVDTA